MTDMRAVAAQFPQLQSNDNLHSRVTRALALQVIEAERERQLLVFPNEGELCRQLGVSRSILREAVKVLEDKGMVQVRPRSGTRSLPRSQWNQLDADILTWQSSLKPDPEFLRDLCEVRLAIEPVAAGFAALRATEQEIVTIRECLGRRQQIIASQDLEAAVEAEPSIPHGSNRRLAQSALPAIEHDHPRSLPHGAVVHAVVARLGCTRVEEYRRLTEAIEQRSPLEAKRAAEELVGFAMLAVEQVIRDHENPKAGRGARRRAPRKNVLPIARSRPEP